MIFACVPTIGASPLLHPLVETLLDDGVDKIILTVNKPNVSLGIYPSDRVDVLETHGMGKSIYVGWRLGIDMAAQVGAHLAILNDDIAFDDPNAVSKASALLTANPKVVILGFNYGPRGSGLRYCRGSYRHGGIGGAAFMVDAARVVEPDPVFEHWGGDDSMFLETEKKGGKLAIANALTFRHIGEQTARGEPWVADAIGRDWHRFEDRYGKGSAW